MLDENKPIMKIIKEELGRIDGKIMCGSCIVSIAMSLIWLLLCTLELKPLTELWKVIIGLFAIPVLIFTSHIRLRQFDTTSSALNQIINSVIVGSAAMVIIYIVFINK